MATEAKKLASPEEYLLLERTSDIKHEYLDGEIVAMAGAGLNHNRIVAELLVSIGSYLRRNGGCEVFPSDMRLHIPVNGLYTYPDVMVVCGKLEFTDEKKDTLTNPTLLIEVLTALSEDHDRGFKFYNYRSIPSLKEYLVIDSTGILAERFWRQPDGTWSLAEYRDRNATLALSSLNLEISLTDVYTRTEGL